IQKYLDNNYDFYGVGKGFPNGINGAIFSFEALEKSYKEARTKNELEHIGEYIKNNRDKFSIGFYDNEGLDKSHYRVTLDTKEDYVLIEDIYEKLYHPDRIILLNDILEYFNNEGR